VAQLYPRALGSLYNNEAYLWESISQGVGSNLNDKEDTLSGCCLVLRQHFRIVNYIFVDLAVSPQDL
jgi:hypothetical protein